MKHEEIEHLQIVHDNLDYGSDLQKSMAKAIRIIKSKSKAMYIGVEVPMHDDTVKILIGLNQEDGDEISYTTQATINEAKTNGQEVWENAHGSLSIFQGSDGFVFDENHNLIETK